MLHNRIGFATHNRIKFSSAFSIYIQRELD